MFEGLFDFSLYEDAVADEEIDVHFWIVEGVLLFSDRDSTIWTVLSISGILLMILC